MSHGLPTYRLMFFCDCGESWESEHDDKEMMEDCPSCLESNAPTMYDDSGLVQ